MLGTVAAALATPAIASTTAWAGNGTTDAMRAMDPTGTPGREAPDATDRTQAPPLGAKIDLPAARLLDGSEIAPEYWRDKVLVVELWATWCPFCARQNPEIDRLHREHAGTGLEVLALSIDRSDQEASRYLRERGYAFHAAMFDTNWRNALGRPKGLPIVWVIGRSGRLEQLEIGEMFPEDVAQLARWKNR